MTTVEFDHDWSPDQARALRALGAPELDLVVLRSGYGAGKSVLGSRWIQRQALQIRGDWLVLAPRFSVGGPATYRVFFEELPGDNTVPNDNEGDPENSPIVAGYNRNKHRLTLVNGSVIRLGSADHWARYAGAEFNGIWADEVAHYEHTDLYDLHEMLVSRQRTDAGPNVTLWTSTGNGYNQFYDVTERQVGADGEPLSWADRMRVIVASSTDNPFLSAEAVEKLKAQFGGTERADQALEGGFSAAQGLVYSSFSRTRHVVELSDIRGRLESGWRIYGYDAGWNDPRVVVELGRTHYGQLVAVGLFYRSGAPIEAVVDPDDVRRQGGWMQPRPAGPVFAEHEPTHIEKFRRAGWRAVEADKSLDEGIPHVQGLLELDDTGRPGLLVCGDQCPELVQEFLSYKEKHVGTSKADDHALDALRYAAFTHGGGPQRADEDVGGVTSGTSIGGTVDGGGASGDVSKFF